jgi:hypothetical protein
LPLLGSAIDGEFETFLGPFGLSLQPTQKRLAVALGLARDLKELAASTLRCPTLQVAWIRLTSVIAHALDFDARVHPSAALLPHAEQLNRAIADTLGGILGVDIGSLEGRVHECITLSAVMGGLGVHEIKQTAPFSFVASRLQVWPAVLRRLEAHGWGAEAIDYFFETGVGRTAELEMRALGVHLDAQGVPSLAEPQCGLDWQRLPAPRPGACGEAVKLLHQYNHMRQAHRATGKWYGAQCCQDIIAARKSAMFTCMQRQNRASSKPAHQYRRVAAGCVRGG